MKRVKDEMKKILSKDILTGDDAGRLMILDLLVAYDALSEGGNGEGMLCNDEKMRIVSTLNSTEDILRFNDYKGVHNFLTHVPAVYDSYAKTLEVYYRRLIGFLTNMMYAEQEKFIHELRPIIMTQDAYSRFLESGKCVPKRGIAVIATERVFDSIAEEGASGFNESGVFIESIPEWREFYAAENTILSCRVGFVKEAIDAMKEMLAECLARAKALELIAKYVRMPQIKTLVVAPEKDMMDDLNTLVSDAVNSVKRISEGVEYEENIKKELFDLLKPIDIDELAPLPADVAKARRALNFSVIKDGSEAFIMSLKRKWRE